MDKKTISTCLRGLVIPVLALVAMAGQAQTFTPIVEDSIDFVITGTTTSSHDSVAMFQCAPIGSRGLSDPLLVETTDVIHSFH